jgi:hypothetical protein
MRSIREPDKLTLVRIACREIKCQKFPRKQTFLTQRARDRFGSIVLKNSDASRSSAPRQTL